jgi:hypothetical protein
VRKKMRVDKTRIGEQAERERTHMDFKSTSSPMVASTTAVASSETAGRNS